MLTRATMSNMGTTVLHGRLSGKLVKEGGVGMRESSLFGPLLGPGVLLFGLAVGLPALAQDPAAGLALAERWCASCHAVAAGAGGSDQVPSFERIVQERDRSEEWLRTWLSVPHESMPSLSLSRQEIADLVAYLKSLRAAE